MLLSFLPLPNYPMDLDGSYLVLRYGPQKREYEMRSSVYAHPERVCTTRKWSNSFMVLPHFHCASKKQICSRIGHPVYLAPFWPLKMGVHGLLKAIRCISKASHLRNYSGSICAIDAFSWLHKGCTPCALDMVEGKRTTEFVSYCMNKVDLLLSHNIQPVMVFDGAPMKAKQNENQERKALRRLALEKTRKMLQNENFKDAQPSKAKRRDYAVYGISTYSKIVSSLENVKLLNPIAQELRKNEITYFVAPYEADAQLAYLSLNGIVDAVISEDSDTLAYGCKLVLFKMQYTGECVEVHWDDLKDANLLPAHLFSKESFQLLCTLAGCDYAKNIPGIGIRKACDLVKKHHTNLREILRDLWKKNGECLPGDYVKRIRMALLTYRHQTIVNAEYKTASLTQSPVELQSEDRESLGPLLCDNVARGICTGVLNPLTHEPFPFLEETPADMLLPTAKMAEASKGEERRDSQTDVEKPHASSSSYKVPIPLSDLSSATLNLPSFSQSLHVSSSPLTASSDSFSEAMPESSPPQDEHLQLPPAFLSCLSFPGSLPTSPMKTGAPHYTRNKTPAFPAQIPAVPSSLFTDLKLGKTCFMYAREDLRECGGD
ncbi:XPG N-terminal domain-containing protein [Cardiosporidium cionae]|uniref:XPG N-terminal domain-containing protein n=1 Tax=Cardiosporidium cionae TaxID=476202 RepID=A0ABQ7JB32_9APIC|nr:XPG N-terminal domain-containing protein [Cardiosporidium cionae]|eukprot:KAF8821201.1 XPG N-terminal domain-containing protein [Cardiosporidium cionae]